MKLLKNPKILLTLVLLIAIAFAVNAIFPFDTPGVQASVSVKPEVLFPTALGRRVLRCLDEMPTRSPSPH